MRRHLMRRRELIAGLCGAAVCSSGARSQAVKVYRIGVLETTAVDANRSNIDAFHRGMSDLGYVEGKGYTLEYRSADGQNQRFDELVTELLRANVDLILTRGTPAALSAKAATKTLPIVMAAIGEPLAIVASLARPGGNITGLTALSRELAAKRVALLKEAVPSLRRVAALLNMGNPTLQADWVEIKRTASRMGMDAILLDIRSQADIATAFQTASKERVDGIVVSNDSLTQTNARIIAELAAQQQIPSSFASREFVAAGGLMTYSVNYADLYRRAATFVDKIFKGAKPADLPVEQPVKFEMVLNMKTAKALGIVIPILVLAQADEVIE